MLIKYFCNYDKLRQMYNVDSTQAWDIFIMNTRPLQEIIYAFN